MCRVHTNYGTIEGEVLESGVSVFKGIPYASPPVGDLRWKRPIPPQKWEGVREAKEFSPIYPQSDDYPFYIKEFGRPSDYPTSEDCLYLNVWTKAHSSADKRPVLFFIHGGGYDHGYGHRTPIDGENFAQKGIVFVSFNYRIGVFGFLSHPLLEKSEEHEIYELRDDEDYCTEDLEPRYIISEPIENYESSENSEYSENSEDDDSDDNEHEYYHSSDGSVEKSGNYGLYDQLAALHWVRDNISHFGGDPDNITLIGQSAGAMSIEIMYESKLTRGLFSKVIMMSGGGYITKIPILKSLGCRSRKEVQRTSGKLLLHTLKCKTLAEARKIPYKELYEAYEKAIYPFTLTPFVDGEIYTQSHRKWEKNLRSLHHKEKEVLLNKNGCSIVDLSDLDYYRSIPMIIGCLQNEFGYQTKTYFYRCTINLCNCLCETVFNHPEFKNKGPYLYFGKYSMPGDDRRGAFHSSELWFVFQMLKLCWRKMGKKEERLANLFSSYWANFSQTGNPNGEGLPTWYPFTSNMQKQLTIEDKKTVMKRKHKF